MCGITGIYSATEAGVKKRVLEEMRDTLVHRGPDSAGIYLTKDGRVGLGFRRLAIIDLSPAADQPMSNEDGTIWLVFNGEIYNFKGLREELVEKGHVFKSHTDSEVIIHLYEEEGEECVKKLEGMFAFVVWDSKKEVLFGARDQMGIKPLYYYRNDNDFIFASEIKAILKHPGVERKVNEEALYHYLTFATTPAPLTLFDDVYKLPAGHLFRYSPKEGFVEREYWSVLDSVGKNNLQSEEGYVSKVRELLKKSINSQVVSDVPFGCFLSGGIDSSTNAVLMSEAIGRPVETFSVGYKDQEAYNELEYSRKVADLLKSDRHEILIDAEDLKGFIEKLPYFSDELNGDWVCFPVFSLSKLIRDSGVIMAQVGEGADELFCGYDSYLSFIKFHKLINSRLFSWLKTIRRLAALAKILFPETIYEIARRFSAGEEIFWGGAIAMTEGNKDKLISRDLRKRLNDRTGKKHFSSYDVVQRIYREIDDRGLKLDYLQRMTYLELRLRLPELLLMRVDKMAMGNSIETRVPFLDKELVELAFSIPMDLKVKNGRSKHILKEAVRGTIPDEIIDRKKQGFNAPVSSWLKEELREYLYGLVFHSKLRDKGYFNYGYVDNLFKDHYSGKADNAFKLWNIITLSIWYDYWFA